MLENEMTNYDLKSWTHFQYIPVLQKSITKFLKLLRKLNRFSCVQYVKHFKYVKLRTGLALLNFVKSH